MIRKSHKQSSLMDVDYICERLVPQDSFTKFKDIKRPVWNLTPNRAFNYNYDGFYRLVTSTGEQDWAPNTQTPQIMQNYGVSTSYDNVHNITNKTQYVNTYSPPGSAPVPYAAKTYNNGYNYGSTHPHAPTLIGNTTSAYSYTYG